MFETVMLCLAAFILGARFGQHITMKAHRLYENEK